MYTDNDKDKVMSYEKPELDVVDIEVEGAILTDSEDEEPIFDIVPGQTGAWW